MQIVIDIPDGYVGVIMANQRMEGSAMDKIIRQAIIDGIPLPKGHGRLIDADAMFKDICNSIESMTNIGIAVDGQYLWGKLNDALFNAPTILEADKVESEG